MDRVKSFQLKVDKGRIESVISNIPKARDKAFIACLYLTGARISEVVKRLKGSDIMGKDGLYYVHLITLKKRAYLKGMPREVPINPANDALTGVLLGYAEDKKDQVLFPFGRTTGWRIVKKYFSNEFPHYFRHARSTILLRTYDNFTFHDLKTFHNWSSMTMANVYVHSDVKDVVRKMKQ